MDRGDRCAFVCDGCVTQRRARVCVCVGSNVRGRRKVSRARETRMQVLRFWSRGRERNLRKTQREDGVELASLAFFGGK